jgi:hypothetical protein
VLAALIMPAAPPPVKTGRADCSENAELEAVFPQNVKSCAAARIVS